MRLVPLLISILAAPIGHAQLGPQQFKANLSSARIETVDGHPALRVEKDSAVKADDEPTFARVQNVEFTDGVIEVKVLSRILKTAPNHARGFIGIAFRIDDSNRKFESIYIRPTNGRADDQVRRNRSIQYFSYPDFKYDRLRKESPGRYETYSDMGLNEWITMRIEVAGKQAKLYLNDAKHPALVVNDLKHGEGQKGGIGLWVDVGTEGFFRDLKITAR